MSLTLLNHLHTSIPVVKELEMAEVATVNEA